MERDPNKQRATNNKCYDYATVESSSCLQDFRTVDLESLWGREGGVDRNALLFAAAENAHRYCERLVGQWGVTLFGKRSEGGEKLRRGERGYYPKCRVRGSKYDDIRQQTVTINNGNNGGLSRVAGLPRHHCSLLFKKRLPPPTPSAPSTTLTRVGSRQGKLSGVHTLGRRCNHRLGRGKGSTGGGGECTMGSHLTKQTNKTAQTWEAIFLLSRARTHSKSCHSQTSYGPSYGPWYTHRPSGTVVTSRITVGSSILDYIIFFIVASVAESVRT